MDKSTCLNFFTAESAEDTVHIEINNWPNRRLDWLAASPKSMP
ncbi:MAG: hypothetical protein ACUVWV_12665 [Thermodesulfobacteriota bacterium]